MVSENITVPGGQEIDLLTMDPNQPIYLIASLQNPPPCPTVDIYNRASYLPSLTMTDINGNILKKWTSSTTSLSINEDIRPLITGLAIIIISFSVKGCAITATTYPPTWSVSINYFPKVIPTSFQAQSLKFPDLEAPFDPNGNYIGVNCFGFYAQVYDQIIDLGLWDGTTAVYLKFNGHVGDGGIILLINKKQVYLNAQPGGPSTFSDTVDITPYVIKGKNDFSVQYETGHSSYNYGLENIEVDFFSPFKIPKLQVAGTITNTESIEVAATISVLSGALTFFTDISSHLQIDTKGMANPSIVDIPDSSVETKISINKTVNSDFTSFPIDVYVVISGTQYLLQTVIITVDKKTTDNRPSITFTKQNMYAQLVSGQIVAEVIAEAIIDNTKSSQDLKAVLDINYFGDTPTTFDIPGYTVVTVQAAHSLIATPAQIGSTGGQSAVTIDGPNKVFVSALFSGSGIMLFAPAPLLEPPKSSYQGPATPPGPIIPPPPPAPSPSPTPSPTPGPTVTPQPISKNKLITFLGMIGAASAGAIVVIASRKPNAGQ